MSKRSANLKKEIQPLENSRKMSDEWGTFASGDNQNDEDADDDWGEFTTTTETKDDDTTPTKVDQQDQQNQQNQE